jgi:hypothetical protein
MFDQCTGLTALPTGFQLPAVPNGTYGVFFAMFRNCQSLTALPAGFHLPAAPKGTEYVFVYMFQDCYNLNVNIGTLITGKILDESQIQVNNLNLYTTFSGCSRLSGSGVNALKTMFGSSTIPPAVGYRFTFHNCTGLSDYEGIPVGWR